MQCLFRNKDLQEILEILPGTTEYKLKELQEAMSRHMKIPECPVKSFNNIWIFVTLSTLDMSELLQNQWKNLPMQQWPSDL